MMKDIARGVIKIDNKLNKFEHKDVRTFVIGFLIGTFFTFFTCLEIFGSNVVNINPVTGNFVFEPKINSSDIAFIEKGDFFDCYLNEENIIYFYRCHKHNKKCIRLNIYKEVEND